MKNLVFELFSNTRTSAHILLSIVPAHISTVQDRSKNYERYFLMTLKILVTLKIYSGLDQ